MFQEDELSCDAFLGGRIKLLQPRHGYRAGTDPVLLAAASKAKPGETVLELGCGGGTGLLCLMARVNVAATGLERLPEYCDLAEKNAKLNDKNIEIICGDLGNPPAQLKEQTFDHVMLNPPFFLGGKNATNAGRAQGRQEDTPLAEWIDQALRRLRPMGYLTLIHLTERLQDVISLIDSRAGDLEIKPLTARNRRTPKRVILRMRKSSNGATTLCNPLILHEGHSHTYDQDSYTAQAKAILADAQPLEF